MEHTIKFFLKFGSKENILDLYENGTVYLNTIEYFRKHEDGLLRGDKYEGASRVINSLPGSFYIPSLNHTVNYISVHLKESHETVLGNLYCLYGVSSHGFPNPLDFKIDDKNAAFGTHCLAIKDSLYFFNRIQEILTAEGYKFRHDFVEYYDKYNVNRELTVFEKPLEYEYQKEFRFYVENDKVEPIKVSIGSLRDYSEVFEMQDILQMKLEAKKEHSL